MEELDKSHVEWTGSSGNMVPNYMAPRPSNKRVLILVILVGIVMFAAGFTVRSFLALHPVATAASASTSTLSRTTGTVSMAASRSSKRTIVVDVHGDVQKPGVYHLAPDARVQDAVKAAGGFVHSQDAGLVNLAASVDDGQEIAIPDVLTLQKANDTSRSGSNKGAAGKTAVSKETRSSSTSSAANTVLNINSADEASLETLPGIGPGRAAAIVEYRKTHGPFRKIEDIQQVQGIGPQIFARIKPYLLTVMK